MKYVLRYESPENLDEEKLRAVFPAHRARWGEFRAQGTLLLIGPFADRRGALGVFTTREAAEAFAASDPFVLEGLVARWTITPGWRHCSNPSEPWTVPGRPPRRPVTTPAATRP